MYVGTRVGVRLWEECSVPRGGGGFAGKEEGEEGAFGRMLSFLVVGGEAWGRREGEWGRGRGLCLGSGREAERAFRDVCFSLDFFLEVARFPLLVIRARDLYI